MKKHLNPKNKLLLVLFTAVILTGCSKEPQSTDYVVKVNNSYLRETDLKEMMDSSAGIIASNGILYREEIIRNWIDKELLYQQAVKEKITNRKDFQTIIDESKKNLAVALFIKQISDKRDVVINAADLENFFNEKKEEFRLTKNAYLFNMKSFNNQAEAINFRSLVIQSDWNSAAKRVEKESLLFTQKSPILTEEDEIYPITLKNLLRELYPREVSIVIETASSVFTVVQVINKFNEGTIPPFELIRDKVEKRFAAIEKQKYLNEYIKTLYAESNIEIKN